MAERNVDDGRVDPTGLVLSLVADLPAAPSGLSFIADGLDRLVAARALTSAYLVIDDTTLGRQLFTPGRRPFGRDGGAVPAAVLARGPGLHVEPNDAVQPAEREAVADLCCVALRLDRLQYESLHDPLTDLYNRRGFDEHLAGAVSRSVRHGWKFGLVLIDLDGFKAINDRLGHQGGDEVLRDIGDRVRRDLRAGDVAARVGGDEFALLLHTEGPVSIESALERLADGTDAGPSHDITWASGMAMCPDEATTLDELYRVADRRLYEAKAAQPGHAQ